MDSLQVPSRNLDIAIEQLPHTHHQTTGPSPSSSRDITPYTSPSHYATPSSIRSTVKRVRYTEIDVSLYDNPRLKSYREGDEEEEEVVQVVGKGEGLGAGPETQKRRRHGDGKVKLAKQNWPHEELLLFVGQEWKDLAVEVRM